MSGKFKIQKIDAASIKSTPRGRKSNADPEFVSALRGAAAGTAFIIPEYALNPKADNYKTEKARVSAMIRSAVKAAGHSGCSVKFTPDGIPQLVIK